MVMGPFEELDGGWIFKLNSFSVFHGESSVLTVLDVSLSELRELVMDREAWRAAIHGIVKSRTRLSDWTELKLTLV